MARNQAASRDQTGCYPGIGEGEGIHAEAFNDMREDKEMPRQTNNLEDGLAAFLDEAAVAPQQVQPGDVNTEPDETRFGQQPDPK